MKILGIETSSMIGSVAICDETSLIAEQSFKKGMLHGKELIPAIKSIFEKNKLTPNDIDLIAVDVGPGSYTGVRVGLSCAKTLAYALGVPVIDVVSLDSISQNIKEKYNTICVVLDARRDMVYASFYKYSPDDKFLIDGKSRLSGAQSVAKNSMYIYPWKRGSDILLTPPNEIINSLPENTFIFGDGVTRYINLFKEMGANKTISIGEEELGIPKASSIAILGKCAYDNDKRCDIKTLSPVYLRQPEAIEKLEKDKLCN